MSETAASTTTDDLAFAGVARQAELVRSRAVTPRALVDLALDRIGVAQPRFGAFARVRAEAARAEAEDAARRVEAGDAAPLLGVPIAVKDNMDISGEPTTHGGAAAGAGMAQADGAIVARLRAAGAIVVGQTSMAPLALYPHDSTPAAGAPVRNPWSPDRTACGSSGGGAAAVAAGLVAAAVGTDGGGSVRLPAAACGLVGLKPQRDRVPLTPDDGHWHGLSHAGPLARSVADAALLLDALTGSAEWSAAAASDPGPLRIRVIAAPAVPTKLAAPQRAALDEVATLLREHGHDVEEVKVRWPLLLGNFGPRYVHGAYLDAQRLGAGRDLPRAARGLVRYGRRLAGAAARAERKAPALVARIQERFGDADVVLTPMLPKAPPPVGVLGRAGAARTFNASGPWAAYSSLWNVTGQPALSLPAGFDDDGLPRAVQLVARPDAEATILALAGQLERARPWTARRPPEG
jgi:amidase